MHKTVLTFALGSFGVAKIAKDKIPKNADKMILSSFFIIMVQHGDMLFVKASDYVSKYLKLIPFDVEIKL
ncbi:MAG TPA: hypothetical protein PK821_04820 [Victivallales bacterium]|nr:hypothetical protein [Victivallales bacterium]